MSAFLHILIVQIKNAQKKGVIKMREQTTERIRFDHRDKKEILQKSGGRCAHCGKPLTHKNATIDHVIPISKGGTNENDNLVALCHECNYKKGDEVINPVAYYKYLSEEHLEIFRANHREYCEDISFLTTKNYMREDRMEVRYMASSKPLIGHRQKTRGGKIMAHCIQASAVLYKAKYEDLNEVKEYLDKYHKKFDLETDYLEESISETFTRGCIYVLKRGFEILAVFPVTIQKRYALSETQESYVMCFSGIPVFYQKKEYLPLIEDCMARINHGVVTANGKNIAVYEVTYPANDQYIKEFVEDSASYGYAKFMEDGDGWERALMCQRWETFRGELKDTDYDPNEDTKYFSQALERIMGLKPIADVDENKLHDIREKFESSNKKSKDMKKERRRIEREMIDEYDVRYYM